MTNIYDLNLIDLLPSSIKNDENIRLISESLNTQLKEITDMLIQTIILPRIDELDENLIDFLAYQFHVDFYEPLGLQLEKKRELVKNSIFWHRRKGTPSVVEEILKLLFLKEFELEEWFNYESEPYFFRITTTDFIKNQQFFEEMIRAIYSVKNTRSWLEMIRLIRNFKYKLSFASASILSNKAITKHSKPVIDTKQQNLFVDSKSITNNSINILQKTPIIVPLKTKVSINIGVILQKQIAVQAFDYKSAKSTSKLNIQITSFYAQKNISLEAV